MAVYLTCIPGFRKVKLGGLLHGLLGGLGGVLGGVLNILDGVLDFFAWFTHIDEIE